MFWNLCEYEALKGLSSMKPYVYSKLAGLSTDSPTANQSVLINLLPSQRDDTLSAEQKLF